VELGLGTISGRLERGIDGVAWEGECGHRLGGGGRESPSLESGREGGALAGAKRDIKTVSFAI